MLPESGQIGCTRCFDGCGNVVFNETRRENGDWRITANPLAWGNARNPSVIVLGFSKGPTQANALLTQPHCDIAYKGKRKNVGKILSHIGLLSKAVDGDYEPAVTNAIEDRSGPFHFGSIVRCTVERFDLKKECWKGSGGAMLDKFVATSFGQEIANNCTNEFLSQLPPSVKLVVMFGLGTRLNYVKAGFDLYRAARNGTWRMINEVAYTDNSIVVVHVEHFASQGANISRRLGIGLHARAKYGHLAKDAVNLLGQLNL
jgi:hypothetical protein